MTPAINTTGEGIRLHSVQTVTAFHGESIPAGCIIGHDNAESRPDSATTYKNAFWSNAERGRNGRIRIYRRIIDENGDQGWRYYWESPNMSGAARRVSALIRKEKLRPVQILTAAERRNAERAFRDGEVIAPNAYAPIVANYNRLRLFNTGCRPGSTMRKETIHSVR